MHGEGKLPFVQKLFQAKTNFFKKDPRARKLQEPGNKQKKINRTVKLCTLATNNLNKLTCQ